MRKAVAGGAIVLALVTFAPPAGEGDRTESTAVGALRAIVSAQMAYASASGGYYATLECLTQPTCIPGEVDNRNAFLDPALATNREWRGYRLAFHAGPAPEQDPNAPASRTAMTRFAVIAAPTSARTAHRAFCGDDRGLIYVTTDGSVPRVADGRCVDTGILLR